MKKLLILINFFIFLFFPNLTYSQVAEWVNNQGCYCGGYSSVLTSYISRGNGTLAERTASQEQMEYWNFYATIYSPSINTGLGAPGNGLNEVNTFITNSDAQSIYGYSMSPSLYGVAIIQPDANFGTFNECKDFTSTDCDYFTETDVLINAGFSSGWTTDPNDYSKALVQTTALHEIGHTWGAHHVFTLPAFGDSYSTMNYINDDSGRFVTRMDANTIRAHYPSVAQSGVDVGIFPFIFGNSKYAETYTSVSPTSVQTGESINISNFLIQNIGTLEATTTVITFYLSTDTTIEDSDYSIGTVEYSSLPVDADNDLNATFIIPDSIPDGTYYIGAIVTVNGVEDSIDINNKFIIGRPNRTQISVESFPSCPSLYFWNGQDFEWVDALFPGAAPRKNEYTDYIPLNKLVLKDGLYYLQIRETEPENSFIDLAKLIIVDHSANNAGISNFFINRNSESAPHTQTFEIWYNNNVALERLQQKSNTTTSVLSPISAMHSTAGISAMHSTARDVRHLLYSSDDRYIHMRPGDIITLVFPYPPLKSREKRDIIFVSEGFYAPLRMP